MADKNTTNTELLEYLKGLKTNKVNDIGTRSGKRLLGMDFDDESETKTKTYETPVSAISNIHKDIIYNSDLYLDSCPWVMHAGEVSAVHILSLTEYLTEDVILETLEDSDIESIEVFDLNEYLTKDIELNEVESDSEISTDVEFTYEHYIIPESFTSSVFSELMMSTFSEFKILIGMDSDSADISTILVRHTLIDPNPDPKKPVDDFVLTLYKAQANTRYTNTPYISYDDRFVLSLSTDQINTGYYNDRLNNTNDTFGVKLMTDQVNTNFSTEIPLLQYIDLKILEVYQVNTAWLNNASGAHDVNQYLTEPHQQLTLVACQDNLTYYSAEFNQLLYTETADVNITVSQVSTGILSPLKVIKQNIDMSVGLSQKSTAFVSSQSDAVLMRTTVLYHLTTDQLNTKTTHSPIRYHQVPVVNVSGVIQTNIEYRNDFPSQVSLFSFS
jgi:hypothetical protein